MIETYDELKRRAREELGARITDVGYKDFPNIRDHKFFYLPNGYKVSILHEFAMHHIPGAPDDWGWELMAWSPLREHVDVCGEDMLDGAELDEIWEGLVEVSKR